MIVFYILVLVSPMPNHPLFEAPFAGLTVVKWLGIICCGYAVVRLLSCRRLPAFLKGLGAPLLSCTAWSRHRVLFYSRQDGRPYL